jgi:hypothetical protein
MGIETQVVDKESGYLFLLLLVCWYSLSTLVYTKLVVVNLLEMPSETPPNSLIDSTTSPNVKTTKR